MDTLACALVPSSAAFLQSTTQLILKSSPSINSKGIKCIARALACPGVNKQAILSAVAQQAPVWAAGAGGNSNPAAVGLATQKVLSMLSRGDATARGDSRDALLGNGCLSDPFILSGIYDALLRTPVLRPSSQEFAFASTPAEASAIHALLLANSHNNTINATGSRGKKASATKKSAVAKKRKCAVGTGGDEGAVLFLGDVSQRYNTQACVERLQPVLSGAIDAAAPSEFGIAVANSKGGLSLDVPLARSAEDLRDRLWQSMLKRGESMVGMYTGVRSARAEALEQRAEKRRQTLLSPRGLDVADEGSSEPMEGGRGDVSPATRIDGNATFDFTDPDVVPYVWRMICACQRRDSIEMLLRRFPSAGNHLLHPPINTGGVGGMGVGSPHAQTLSAKSYARILSAIDTAPCRDYLVGLLDVSFIEGSLLAGVEESQRESVREWAAESLLFLERLTPLSDKCLTRLVGALTKRPLVSLGLPSSGEVFGLCSDLLLNPRLGGLRGCLDGQLCDAFWNVTRVGQPSSVLAGLHATFYSLHQRSLNANTVGQQQQFQTQFDVLRAGLRDTLFQHFASRLSQDAVTERSATCQATFAAVAAALGSEEGVVTSSNALKGIFAFQQAQYDSLANHVQTTRDALLDGPSRDSLRELSMNPMSSHVSRELLLRMAGTRMDPNAQPDLGLEADTAVIKSHVMRAPLTSNSVVSGLVEGSGWYGGSIIEPGSSAVPMQHRGRPDVSPPVYASHLLGPVGSGASLDVVSKKYITDAASARLLASVMIFPQLSKDHSWHNYACNALAGHFGFGVDRAPLALKPAKKTSRKTKAPATPDPSAQPHRIGYTVPICRAMAVHYMQDASFRSSLDIVGCAAGTTMNSAPVNVNAAVSAAIPVVVGHHEAQFIDALVRCATASSRAVVGESVTF